MTSTGRRALFPQVLPVPWRVPGSLAGMMLPEIAPMAPTKVSPKAAMVHRALRVFLWRSGPCWRSWARRDGPSRPSGSWRPSRDGCQISPAASGRWLVSSCSWAGLSCHAHRHEEHPVPVHLILGESRFRSRCPSYSPRSGWGLGLVFGRDGTAAWDSGGLVAAGKLFG